MDSLSLATSILTRAITLDTDKRYTESLVCYQEGINILLETLKHENEPKKTKIRSKTEEYMSRAEKVKLLIEDAKQKGSYREQIQVPEDAVGFSYKSVLSRFLNDEITQIQVDDPYIRSNHQCDNFVRFLELCVTSCSKLKVVKLVTGKDLVNGSSKGIDQAKRLESIQQSLHKIRRNNDDDKYNSVQLLVEYSDSLHDREIRLDNGWVIKIGRGLDYFKQMDRFRVGFSDFDLRNCRATTIDIFHKKELQKIK